MALGKTVEPPEHLSPGSAKQLLSCDPSRPPWGLNKLELMASVSWFPRENLLTIIKSTADPAWVTPSVCLVDESPWGIQICWKLDMHGRINAFHRLISCNFLHQLSRIEFE